MSFQINMGFTVMQNLQLNSSILVNAMNIWLSIQVKKITSAWVIGLLI